MDTSIDYRLVFALMNGKVADAFNRKLSENFAKAQVPLTAEQWNVLLTLSMREVATQQQICADTSFSKATMTRLVDQLETEGILERFKARVDWRSNYLRMTRKGLVIRDKGLYIASRTLRAALKGLTNEQVSTTQNSLNTVLENLKQHDHVTPPEEIAELMKFYNLRKNKGLRR